MITCWTWAALSCATSSAYAKPIARASAALRLVMYETTADINITSINTIEAMTRTLIVNRNRRTDDLLRNVPDADDALHAPDRQTADKPEPHPLRRLAPDSTVASGRSRF
jgi:hypothetical protein